MNRYIKNTIIVFIISLFFVACKQLSHEKTEIVHLNSRAKAVAQTHADSAMSFASTALAKSLENNYTEGIASSLKMRGVIYYYQKKYRQALVEYDSASFYFLKLEAIDSIAAVNYNKALIYQELGNDFFIGTNKDSALSYYQKAQKILENQKATTNLSSIYLNIGNLYIKQKEFDKARFYLNQSDSLYRWNTGDTTGRAENRKLWGDYYFYRGEKDSFPHYYTEAEKLYLQLADTANYAKLLNDRGMSYFMQTYYDSAFYYFDKSLQIKELYNDSSGISNSLNNCGYTLIFIGKFKEAEVQLQKAERIALQIGDDATLLEIYDSFVDLYKIQKQFDAALVYFQKYHNLYKKHYNRLKDKNIKEIEAKYETTKKDEKIRQQHTELKQQELIITISVFAFISIVLILILFIYIFKKKSEYRKKELEGKQKELARTEQMAHGLGHAIKQPVSRMSYAVQQLSAQIANPDNASIRYIEMIMSNSEIVQQKMALLRKFGKPEGVAFTKQNIINAIEDVVQKVLPIANDKNIRINLEIPSNIPEIEMNRDLMTDVFENLITNAIQSVENKQGEIWINVRKKGKQIQIEIKDTGKGVKHEYIPHIFEPFYTKDKKSGTGLGLSIVKHNINLHNGTVDVRSTVGSGTVFIIQIPIKKSK